MTEKTYATKETLVKFGRRMALCTTLFLTTLAPSFAQRVQTDFDHQANFVSTKPILGKRSHLPTLSGIPA